MILVAILIAGFVNIGGAKASDDRVTVTIGTGRIGGIYHPVGGALCKLVNEGVADHGINCTVEIGGGSNRNLAELRDGAVELALVQSDGQHDAFKGVESFAEEGPFDSLRSMFGLYVENVTIVARGDKGINSFEDLKGKRLYTGPSDSGQRKTINVLMEAEGWTPDEVTEVSEYEASNLAEALCDNEFDAFYYTVGHPNSLVKEAAATCDAVLVPISGKMIEKLISRKPYYVKSNIPGGMYRNNENDVPTLGLVASLVTTTETEPGVIYQITKVFFENLDRLRDASPLFSSLSEHEMIASGLTAPAHDGAMRYFEEVGLK